MELFGDDSPWGAAAFGGMVTAILTALGVFLVRLYNAKGRFAIKKAEVTQTLSDIERKTESAILREYKQLVLEQKKDLNDQREQIHDLRSEMNILSIRLATCQAGRAKADERIANLEEALDREGVPYRKWSPNTKEE